MRHNKTLYKGRSGPVVCTSTTHPLNPYIGMEILESDTGSILYFYGGATQWAPPWNTAWGEIFRATSTTGQANLTVATDVTGLTTTFTAITGRRYKTSAYVPAIQNASPGGPIFAIVDGANTSINQWRLLVATGTYLEANVFHTEAISAGSVTRKIRVFPDVGNVSTQPTASNPCIFEVEDIGRVPGVAPV